MFKLILNWIFPPITLADYSQRQQENFYFWMHEAECDAVETVLRKMTQ